MVPRTRLFSIRTTVIPIIVQGLGCSSLGGALGSASDASRLSLSEGEKVISTSPYPVSACSGRVKRMTPCLPLALL